MAHIRLPFLRRVEAAWSSVVLVDIPIGSVKCFGNLSLVTNKSKLEQFKGRMFCKKDIAARAFHLNPLTPMDQNQFCSICHQFEFLAVKSLESTCIVGRIFYDHW